jgi:hypothetical protein
MVWAKEYIAFKIDGRWPLMVQEGELIVSSHCYPLTDVDKCDVNRQFSTVKKDPKRKYNLLGGKHPGSVLCQDLLGGRVAMGRDTKGHSSSFCQFKDQSLISTNGLVYILKQKGVYP